MTCSFTTSRPRSRAWPTCSAAWFTRDFPECIGIFRAVAQPTYDDLVNKQIEDVVKAKGKGKLEDLFASDDTWVVQ